MVYSVSVMRPRLSLSWRADKVAVRFQFLERCADGVHALLADGGKSAGGIIPLVGQREHFGQQTDGFQRQGRCPAGGNWT